MRVNLVRSSDKKIGKVIGLFSTIAFVSLLYFYKYSAVLVSSGSLPFRDLRKNSEDAVFITSVNLISNIRLPITIQQVSIRSAETNVILSPSIYLFDAEKQPIREGCGYFTESEFRELYREIINIQEILGNDSSNNYKFKSKNICFILLFEDPPMIDGDIEVICQYKLLNIFSNSTHTILRREKI